MKNIYQKISIEKRCGYTGSGRRKNLFHQRL